MPWILETWKHRRDKRMSRSKWFALTIVSHPKVAAERTSKATASDMHFRGSLCSHLKVTIGGSDSVSIKYALKENNPPEPERPPLATCDNDLGTLPASSTPR
jgi:hypothetical protein